MKSYNLHKRFIMYVLFIAILSTYLLPTNVVYGAAVTYYDYTKGQNVSYTGKQVKYLYNGRELPLEQAGILVDGTALADYYDLFVEELGLTAVLNNDQVTITDGNKIIVVTVGSKEILMDGKLQTMNTAPVKLKFSDGKTRVYVPTRIISEYFGYSYVWVSSSSTVKITKTLCLNDGTEDFNYNGTFYSISYENEKIPLGKLPILYHEGTILARADVIFSAADCYYEEFDNQIVLSKGDIIATMTLNEKTVYVNGSKFLMDGIPYRITDRETKEVYSYIPLEFAADILGFELSYDDNAKQYSIKETSSTGIAALNSLLNSATNGYSDPENVYYRWTGSLPETAAPEYHYLTEVTAYGGTNADIIELYGASADNINAFLDNGLLVVEMKNTIACFDSQYYNNVLNPHLTYTLLSGLSNRTILYLMIPTEDTWHIVEDTDCVRIYLAAEELSMDDLYISSSQNENYPDNMLVIPLPDGVITITDQDNYADGNFQIRLKGNYLNFYRTNAIYNPYYVIKNYTVTYENASDTTILTFRTNTICAYQYIKSQTALYVEVGRPNEIYDKIVVLDAGHGGIDPGASKNGIKEKDLNFTIMNTYVKEKFRNSDIKVYFTRDTDVLIDLYERADFASEVGADLFLSLHMNANNSSSVSGTQVFYSNSNNSVTASGLTSYKLAKTLADNLSTALNTKNRGASSAEFVVVKYNTVPAVLIELAFMTNSSDLEKLTNPTYQEKAANVIYETVVQIFKDYPTGR